VLVAIGLGLVSARIASAFGSCDAECNERKRQKRHDEGATKERT
jgi:hypothetical protein